MFVSCENYKLRSWKQIFDTQSSVFFIFIIFSGSSKCTTSLMPHRLRYCCLIYMSLCITSHILCGSISHRHYYCCCYCTAVVVMQLRYNIACLILFHRSLRLRDIFDLNTEIRNKDVLFHTAVTTASNLFPTSPTFSFLHKQIFINMIHINLSYYIIHAFYVSSPQWNFSMSNGFTARSVLSSLPLFFEVDYIRASVSVLKTRLRIGYAGQTESRLHAHSRRVGVALADRNDKWHNRYSTFILSRSYH